MRNAPDGYRLYFDVLSAFDDWKQDGQYVSFRCLFPERHRNGDRNWSGRMWVGSEGQLVAGCFGCHAKRQEIIERSGTDPAAWYPTKWKSEGRRRMEGKVVARYQYANGLVKERIEPGPNGRKKSFRWTPSGSDLDPGLYRLDEMLAADVSQPVCVVEGEKDVDNLRALGFVAVCPPHGSNAWSGHYAKHFRGRRAVVFADNDSPGISHAEHVAGSLMVHRATAVRLILPGADWNIAEGDDISAWLDCKPKDGRERRAALAELCKRFPLWELKQLKAA